jgi:Cu+-exporting ATPase
VDTVAFDKTGTLTVGQPRLAALVPAPGRRSRRAARAASLQSGSEHPLARAVLAARDRGLAAGADAVRAVPGRGSEGEVQASWLLGSLRWMEELGVALGPLAGARRCRRRAPRCRPWCGAGAGAGAALLAFGDEPKPGAREALAALRRAACAR